jgi:ubiquitin C-terminal hydrolase
LIIDLTGDEVPKLYSPINFRRTLAKENQEFAGTRQQDSNELLQYMINEFADEKSDKGFTNLIKKICFGKYKQYIYCEECKKVTESYFSFLDVILPIPNMENPDLEDCFKKYAQYEKMDSKRECPNCKKKTTAYRKAEIFEVPEVAVFTFSRFRGNLTKINTPIKFYQLIELEGKKLKLIATINQTGDIKSGHCYANISRNDRWFEVDDSKVKEINVESILNDPKVYMLIYQVDYE